MSDGISRFIFCLNQINLKSYFISNLLKIIISSLHNAFCPFWKCNVMKLLVKTEEVMLLFTLNIICCKVATFHNSYGDEVTPIFHRLPAGRNKAADWLNVLEYNGILIQ